MSATSLPSNFVTPDEKFERNPNWTPFEASVPQANLLTEPSNGRLMVCVGKHPKVLVGQAPTNGAAYSSVIGENLSAEEQAIFSMRNLSVQQCTALQLEEVVFSIPGSGAQANARNLTNTLCGDYVDDIYAEPRRFVFAGCDMTLPIMIAGDLYSIDITNFLPNGRSISYYSLGDILNYVVSALNSFMLNRIGDATFFSSIYVDSLGPRLFWTSTTYGLNKIRFVLSEFIDRAPSFFNLLLNHINITDIRVGDTSQAPLGYATGESIGFHARSQTGIQNNALLMTIHSNELTQFRKSDSIAPIEGSSLIATCYPFDLLHGASLFKGSITNSTMVSPKICFDRTQTLTEFTISLRVLQNMGDAPVQLKGTELHNAVAILTFRLW